MDDLGAFEFDLFQWLGGNRAEPRQKAAGREVCELIERLLIELKHRQK